MRSLSLSPWHLVAVAGAALALLWLYLPVLASLFDRWTHDPQYSHGYLVPAFSAYLLWSRRGQLAGADLRPSWWGLVLLVASLGISLTGTYLTIDWLQGVSLLGCLGGLFVLGGGWPALRWAWPGIGFLMFMIPLPFRLQHALGGPLQRFGTVCATFVLQTLGFAAFSEGNIITLGEGVRIGVVEACSGLSMLMIFFALSTAVAILLPRAILADRIVIVLSAIPIALFANLTRIIVTAVLHKTVGSHFANIVFHDLAGWLMMPLALILMWLELRAIAWVLVEPAPVVPRPMRMRRLTPQRV
jgi:exosortase